MGRSETGMTTGSRTTAAVILFGGCLATVLRVVGADSVIKIDSEMTSSGKIFGSFAMSPPAANNGWGFPPAASPQPVADATGWSYSVITTPSTTPGWTTPPTTTTTSGWTPPPTTTTPGWGPPPSTTTTPATTTPGWTPHPTTTTPGWSPPPTSSPSTTPGWGQSSTASPTPSWLKCPEEDAEHPTYFPHESSCPYFYQCSHGRAFRLRCRQGLHFNPRFSVCDFPKEARCPYDMKDGYLAN